MPFPSPSLLPGEAFPSPNALITTQPLDTGNPPQFAAPFRLDESGKPVTVEQGDLREIGAAIYNVIVCPQGAKLNDPTFGIPEPLFSPVPLDATTIIKTVQKLEPRASAVTVQQALVTMRELDVRIAAQVSSGTAGS